MYVKSGKFISQSIKLQARYKLTGILSRARKLDKTGLIRDQTNPVRRKGRSEQIPTHQSANSKFFFASIKNVCQFLIFPR